MERYPLTWPLGQKRTESNRRLRGAFKVGFATARDDLLHSLKLLGASGVILSSSVPVRLDGIPYASAREPDDPGVAVYFDRFTIESGTRSYVIACDTYAKVAANLRAIGATVEALRAIQRHGATSMLEQAFSGFAALPPAFHETAWWDVLGVIKSATREQIIAAHRELTLIHHPDRGGDSARMGEINRARDQALETR